jgi:hypothetical protein
MRWPDPTTDEPTEETLTQWSDDHGSCATDGCWLEGDTDACEHGHPSWLVVLGLVPELRGE